MKCAHITGAADDLHTLPVTPLRLKLAESARHKRNIMVVTCGGARGDKCPSNMRIMYLRFFFFAIELKRGK
jgi:hypothetical protein